MAQHAPGDEWKDETFDDDRSQRRDPVRPILVAVDFSAVARHALAWALDHAQHLGAEVHTIHVIERRFHAGDLSAEPTAIKAELSQIHAEAAAELAKLVDADARAKVPHLHEHVAFGSPADEIVGIAHDLDAGMIVIGSHGRGAIERVLLGSTAERVVRAARCPVLVVKTEQVSAKM
jgi:nucleotide-binding universal stress UspA family protein